MATDFAKFSTNYDLIDFHSHILPGVDHGSSSIETTLFQLRSAKNLGINKIIATSHFYPARMKLEDFLAKRSEAKELLSAHLTKEMPKIAVGAEVYCQPGLENMEGLEQLCIAGTRCMLLEMPLGEWSDAHFETVDALSNSQFTLIMAHIDRYPEYDVERLMQLNVKAQVNAESLCAFLRRRRVKKWFEKDLVYAIGSDLHGAQIGGYNYFAKGLSVLGEEAVSKVMAHSVDLLQRAIYLN